MEKRQLSDLIDPTLIKDLEAETKKDALAELIELIGISPKILDRAAFAKAILAREGLTSTGIGLSVAIPHAKVSAVSDYVIAFGRHRGGIEFDSLDGQPVKLVFMVGASDAQAIEFVRLLAQIVNLIKDGSVRVALLEAETPEDIMRIIQETEAQ